MPQNIHLVARWLSTLDKKIERYSTGSHEDYRVFISAEPAPTPEAHIIPQGILENAIKITNEPPTGMYANLHKALDLFTQVGGARLGGPPQPGEGNRGPSKPRLFRLSSGDFCTLASHPHRTAPAHSHTLQSHSSVSLEAGQTHCPAPPRSHGHSMASGQPQGPCQLAVRTACRLGGS